MYNWLIKLVVVYFTVPELEKKAHILYKKFENTEQLV